MIPDLGESEFRSRRRWCVCCNPGTNCLTFSISSSLGYNLNLYFGCNFSFNFCGNFSFNFCGSFNFSLPDGFIRGFLQSNYFISSLLM